MDPIGITVPDDRYVYVANMGDDTISVLDINRGTVARTIAAGDEPDGIVFVSGEPGKTGTRATDQSAPPSG